MTNPQNTQPPAVDPFAQREARPAVSFDPSRGGHSMGQMVMLEVKGWPNLVESRDPKTKEVERYDDGNPKMKVVVDVVEEGVEKSLWAKKPGGLLAAIQAATKAAQEKAGDPNLRIGPGGKLAIKWVGEGERSHPTHNAPKIFQAWYQPGVEVPAGGDPFAAAAQPAQATVPPVTQTMAQPAAQQAPATAPAAQQPVASQDPWADAAPQAAPAAQAPAAAQPAAAPAAPAAQPAAAESDPFGDNPPPF